MQIHLNEEYTDMESVPIVCAGILCVGRYCAGETMIDRLNKMANVHVQTNRYDVIWGNCGTGAFNKRRINFQRPFTETPQVIVSIAHYDLCHFHGYNRALTYVESADANGFTAVAQTWADTRLYGLVIEVTSSRILTFLEWPNCSASSLS